MGGKESKNDDNTQMDEVIRFSDFGKLPQDMVREICSQMTMQDLTRTITTSKKVYAICKPVYDKRIEEYRLKTYNRIRRIADETFQVALAEKFVYFEKWWGIYIN